MYLYVYIIGQLNIVCAIWIMILNHCMIMDLGNWLLFGIFFS